MIIWSFLFSCYLIGQDIDCWDDQNLLYYSETNVEKDMSLVEYISKPYCICLPLYCIKNNNKDIDLR